MIKAGIVGGAGYTAGELLRLLINHPQVVVEQVTSTSQAGRKISAVHQGLTGWEKAFSGDNNFAVDVLFLCLGHGKATKYLAENKVPGKVKVIDLSQDFRLADNREISGRVFTYGLPEANKKEIARSHNIANPGCFATAIQEALLPLAANNWLTADIHINAITGATGAGQQPTATTHFSWRDNNVSIYKAFTHQHLGEIGETLRQLQGGFDHELNFIPVRGNFSRGIFATLYTRTDKSIEEIEASYKTYYAGHPFVHIADAPIHLKQVVNTNNVLLYLAKHGHNLLITSTIDNLIKGASGQAVQNMNLMFGLEETLGLKLKASAF